VFLPTLPSCCADSHHKVTIENLEFSQTERRLYDSIYASAKHDFDMINEQGSVGKNYTHLLALLMKSVIYWYYLIKRAYMARLRRAVLHPYLVRTTDDEKALLENSKQEQKQGGVIDIDAMIEDQDTKQASGSGPSYASTVLAGLSDVTDPTECPICIDVLDRPVIAPQCMHQW